MERAVLRRVSVTCLRVQKSTGHGGSSCGVLSRGSALLASELRGFGHVGYSKRRATSGSMRVARRAGT
jgi:hypothetical protein